MTATERRRRMSPARRYTVRFTAGMLLYLITLFAAVRIADATGGRTWLFALLTFPAIAIIAWALVAYYRESDELERQKLGESFTIAFAIGTPLVLAIGLLQSFGLGPLNWMLAFGIYMAAWGVGAVVAALRYR